MGKEKKDNASELSEMIKKRNKKKREEQEDEELNIKRMKKRQMELEEEEEEERKKRRINNFDTEEDDENLKEDDDEQWKNKEKNEEQEDDDANEDDEANEDEQDIEERQEDKNKDGNSNEAEKKDTSNSKESLENNKDGITGDQSNSDVRQLGEKTNGGVNNMSNTSRGVTPSAGETALSGETAASGTAGAAGASGTAGAVGTGGAAGAAGAGGTAAASGAGIGIFATVIIVILVIIVLIGIIFFFITMPGSVVGKIGDAINSFRKSVDGFINGDDYAKIMVTREHMIDAAEYLDQMGYDLKGYGFLTKDAKCCLTARNDNNWKAQLKDWWDENDVNESPTYKDFSTKSLEERKEEDPNGDFVEVYVSLSESEILDKIQNREDLNKYIVLVKDSEGNVEFVKSKYLLAYLTADNAVYLIRNQNTNIKNRVAKLIHSNNPTKGSGLITFLKGGTGVSKYIINTDGSGISSDFADEESWVFDRVSVNRAQRSMIINNSHDGWLRTSYYTYNLDGWATKYGVPLQLSLVNHLSSLAPDFAYEVAKIGAQDTMVEFGLVKSTGNTYKMKLYLDIGDGKKYYYLEKKETDSWDLTKVNTDESGNKVISGEYDARTLLGYTSDVDLQTIQNEKPQSKTGDELNKEIDEFENELKQSTDDGKNKIDIGQYVYAFEINANDKSPYDIYVDDQTKIADSFKNNNLYQSGYDYGENDGDTSRTTMNVTCSEYLTRFVKILYNNDLIELYEFIDNNNNIDNKKHYIFRFKSNIDSGTTMKLKNIFTTYFYQTADLIKMEEQYQRKINNDERYTIEYKKMEPNPDENGIMTYKNTKDKHEDGYLAYYPEYKVDKYLIYSHNANYEDDVGKSSGDIGYYKASMDTIWEFLFNESGYNYFEYLKTYTNENHREKRVFYRLVDANTGDAYTDIGDNYDFIKNESAYYENSKGWFWEGAIPIKIENAFNKEIKEGESSITGKDIIDIFNKVDDAETNDYTKYIPIILKVQDHWYQDISFENCYKWDTSEGAKETVGIYVADKSDNSGIKKAADKGIIYTVEQTKGKIVQIADAKTVGAAGEKIQELLEEDYYIYDGVNRSEKKQKIDFKNTAVDAIAMLEEIHGEDSQEIIRMYKELMLKYGIYFKESDQTALKKELFSRIIEGYNDKEKIIPEGDDSVIRANIPPAQEGFERDLNVLMPINGKITRKTDDSICIEIISPGEDYDGYTIFISGFDVDSSINVGQQLSQGVVIGKTKIQDLKLTLRDNNGAIVKNSYSNESLHDYNVKISGIKYTRDELINIFTQYKNIHGVGQLWIDNVDAFFEIQSEYGVDPLFAAAVTMTECTAGTNQTDLVKNAYNWVSIKGSKNGGYIYNNSSWNKYSSYSDAISGKKGLGDLIANGDYYFRNGKYKISEIGLVYCDDAWAVTTSNVMNELVELGGKEYEEN